MSTLCAVCSAPSDGFICARDTLALRSVLASLPAKIRDLETAATKQARIDQAPTGHRPSPPEDELADAEERSIPAHLRTRMGRITLPATALPLSLGAATLHAQAVNGLSTWARHISETRGVDGPTGGVLAVCAWLIAVIDAIRMDEAAGEMHRALLDLSATIDATVDRRDPDIYAGRCDKPDVRADLIDGVVVARAGTCGVDLYASLDEPRVTCQACGAEYDLAERKRELLDQVDDVWARPHTIANALTSLDEPVNASTLRTWIERDAKLTRRVSYPLILQVGIDDEGRPLFRVGDVRARIVAMMVAKAERMSA